MNYVYAAINNLSVSQSDSLLISRQFMDAFDCPQNEIWNSRKEWIESEIEESMTGFSYLVSDHATALFLDLQICYCAGAFLSGIILSVSIIDAHLRETEAFDNSMGDS
jgi:hypothetical protein